MTLVKLFFIKLSTSRHVPEDYRRGHAELDEYLFDVVVQRLLVQIPGCLVVGGGPRRGIRRAAVSVDGAWLRREQLIQEPLRCRQNLLRQLAYEILREFLQLLAVQARQRLAHRGP